MLVSFFNCQLTVKYLRICFRCFNKNHIISLALFVPFLAIILIEIIARKIRLAFFRKHLFCNNDIIFENFLIQFYFSSAIFTRSMYNVYFAFLGLIARLLFLPIGPDLSKWWNRIYCVGLLAVSVYVVSESGLNSYMRQFVQQSTCFPTSNLNYFVSFVVVPILIQFISQLF